MAEWMRALGTVLSEITIVALKALSVDILRSISFRLQESKIKRELSDKSGNSVEILDFYGVKCIKLYDFKELVVLRKLDEEVLKEDKLSLPNDKKQVITSEVNTKE